MGSDRAYAAAPLRPSDPTSLGTYQLLGRLGEGGMGTVFLARSVAGVLVAVKMVRVDLASDDEFRRRFRSEVNRARQVPPFCTAEVLDADPDGDHPYLVVEFVDGPSLAEVVQERGPLTSSNLHGVAIGVATALTAIHGAGVVHRDLKPRNVLLAPGSPKVIDFGIAKALDATIQHTRPNQMIGTVDYMAPESFDNEAGRPLTAAADIFAWGSVVTYAGTGRTAFKGASAPATAVKILTVPPDLSGLSGSLRDLVAHALAKDPKDRPTARQLLDLLLTTGQQRSSASAAATAAAFAHQPELREAVHEAQAATGFGPTGENTTQAVPAPLAGHVRADGTEPGTGTGTGPGRIAGAASVTGRVRVDGAPAGSAVAAGPGGGRPSADDALGRIGVPSPMTFSGPAPVPVGFVPGSRTSVDADSGITQQVKVPASSFDQPPGEPPDVAPPPEPAAGRPRRTPRRRLLRWLLAVVMALVVLAAAVMVTFPGIRHLVAEELGLRDPGVIAESEPDDGRLVVTDPLTAPHYWQASADPSARNKAGCAYEGTLTVTLRDSTGTWRCQGPRDMIGYNQRVEVGVRLLTPGSCASIWLRSDVSMGYQVRVCSSQILLGTHKHVLAEVISSFPNRDDPIVVGGPVTRIRVTARGDRMTVERDGRVLGSMAMTDPEITRTKIYLGIFTEEPSTEHAPPYRVAFSDAKIWSLDV